MTPSASPSRISGTRERSSHAKAGERYDDRRVGRQSDGGGIFVLRGGEVVHMHGLAVEDGAPGRPVAADRPAADDSGKPESARDAPAIRKSSPSRSRTIASSASHRRHAVSSQPFQHRRTSSGDDGDRP